MNKDIKPLKISLALQGLLLWTCLAIPLYIVPSCHGDHGAKTKSLIEKATLTFQIPFSVDSSLHVWNKVLDHPVLIGKLWNSYNFQPAYQITERKEGINVVDPSGIEGDLAVTAASPNSRTFYGQGAIDHWAVPSFISAEGVFQFRYQEEGTHITGRFEVYLRGNNEVANFLMNLFSGTLKGFIHNRFTNNMADLNKIIFDLGHHPEEIRKRVAPGPLEDFSILLPVAR